MRLLFTYLSSLITLCIFAQTTVYTVDPTGNGTHTTIQAALNEVNGKTLTQETIIEIAPGTYDEELSLKAVTGELRLTSTTRDPDDVIIRNSKAKVENDNVLTLTAMNNLDVSRLTFQSEDLKHQLIGIADSCIYITIHGCRFKNGITRGTKDNFAVGTVIDISDFQMEFRDITISGCYFDDITPFRNSAIYLDRPRLLTFSRNIVDGQNLTVWGGDRVTIESNRFIGCNINSVTTFDFLEIRGNFIDTDYGALNIFSLDDTEGEAIIYNNSFINRRATAVSVRSEKKVVSFYNNSFKVLGREHACLFITESDTLKLYNNLFYVDGQFSSALLFSDSAYKSSNYFVSDHNSYFVIGGEPWRNVQKATGFQLSDIRTLGHDSNSIYTDPIFENDSILNPGSADLVDAGKKITLVSRDITGALRTGNPDIGAYELKAIADLQIARLTPPRGTMEGGKAIELRQQISNRGKFPIQKEWEDHYYLSKDRVLDDKDVHFDTKTYNYLFRGVSSVTRIESVTLPVVPTDSFYIILQMNADSVPFEQNFDNNVGILGPYQIRKPDLPDLKVENITAPVTQFSGKSFELFYSVANRGEAITSGSWMDYIYVANDPQLLADSSIKESDSLLQFKRSNPQALDTGESYTNSVKVTLPLRYSGNIYYRVQSDAEDVILENNSAYLDNGRTTNPIAVVQSPMPDLQISNFSTLPTAFSGDKIPVSWVVKNVGRQKTYRTNQTMVVPRIVRPRPNFWFDAVFLSRKPYYDPDEGSQRFLTSYYREGELDIDEQYTVSDSIEFLSCEYGKYYLFAVTNADGNTFELSFSNNITLIDSVEVIIDPMPDLVPISLEVKGDLLTGRQAKINYTVLNDGFSVKPKVRSVDAVYLSPSSELDIKTAVLLGTNFYNDQLEKEKSYTEQVEFKLPYDMFGTNYLFLVADQTDNICEADREGNNTLVSSPVEIRLSPQPDLEPTLITRPDTLIAGESYPVIFEVNNFGKSDADQAKWVDKVIFDSKSQYTSNPRLVLPQGMSYLDTTYIQVPIEQEEGDAFIGVISDATDVVYEHMLEENNLTEKRVYVKRDVTKVPDVELISSKSVDDDIIFGDTLKLEYQLVNLGAEISQKFWKNKFELFSRDELIYSYEFNHDGRISSTNETVHIAAIPLPYQYAKGTYTYKLTIDNRVTLKEYNLENNDNSGELYIEEYNAPDIYITDVWYPNIPDTINTLSAMRLRVNGRIKGVDTFRHRTIKFKSYLSKDRQGSNPVNVQYFTVRPSQTHTGIYFNVQHAHQCPHDLKGDYFTIVEADYANEIYEDTAKANNRFVTGSTITVSNQRMNIYPTDINVTSSTLPFDDFLKVNYTIEQQDIGRIKTEIQDQIVLSRDKIADAGDYRFAYSSDGVLRELSYGTGSRRYKDSLAFSLPQSITPGWYFVGVVFDAKNNVNQKDESRNALFTSDSFYIDFTEKLVLDESKTGSFYEGTRNSQNIYSLERSADLGMLITLDFENNDASSEMYHRVGQVPNRTQYDNRYNNPFLADQQILVSVTDTAVTDYISVVGSKVPFDKSLESDFECFLRSASTRSTGGVIYIGGNCDLPQKSEYTLLAESKTYSLHGIYPDSGSYYGTTSIGIQGFDFEDGMEIYLVKNKDTIYAQYTNYIDRTNLAAHFDLRDKEAGKYDVIASKTDGSLTALESGFTVYEGPTATPFTNVHTTTDVNLVDQNSVVTVDFGNRAHSNGYDYWLLVAFANQSFNTDHMRTQYIGSSEEDMYNLLDEHPNPPRDSAYVDIDGMRYYAYWIPVLPAKAQTTFTYNFSNTEEEYTLVQAQLIQRPLNDFQFAQNPTSFTKSATMLEMMNLVIGDGEVLQPKAGNFDCDNINMQNVEKELLKQTWAVGQRVNGGFKVYSGARSFKDVINKTIDARANDLKSAVDIKGNFKSGLKDHGNLKKLALSSEKSNWDRMKDYGKSVLDGANPYENLKKLVKPKDPPFKAIITNVFGCLDQDAVAQKLSDCMIHRRKLNIETGKVEETSEMSQACKEKYGIDQGGKNPTWRERLQQWVGSFDPNEIVGPEGEGELRIVKPEDVLDYTIHFENLETATAPARFVAIDNPLDSTFRLQNFYFTSFGFGDTVIYVEPTNSLNLTIPLGKKYNYKNLNIVAGIDVIGRKAIWRFSTVDPETGALVVSPFDGFLPPNDSTNIGQGFVTYEITAERNLPSGTVLRNQADIIFDGNAIISTNIWENLVLDGLVGSRVVALPEKSDTTFTVSWQSDSLANVAGVKSYTIFVAKNNEPYSRWITASAAGSTEFTGESGVTYRFYSQVETADGEIERAPQDYDAITTVTKTANVKEIITRDEDNTYLTAYPNPTRGMLTLKYASREDMKVSVMNLNGVTLVEQTLPPSIGGKTSQLDLSDFASGIYILKVLSGTKAKYIRIIKE